MLNYALLIILELATAFFTNSGVLGGLKNGYRLFISDGAWSQISYHPSIETNQIKDDWIEDVKVHRLILHALGDYEFPNTLAGAQKSFLTNVKLLEVDIYKDQYGNLRCHHGPELPPPLTADSCTLRRLLNIIPADRYLVLDIKSSFVSTADSVIKLLNLGVENPDFVLRK